MPPTPPPLPAPTEYPLVRHPNYYVNAIQWGDALRVTTTQGTVVEGTLLDLTSAGVTVLCANCLQHVPMPQVERIQWLEA